jgi:hypothetical protein
MNNWIHAHKKTLQEVSKEKVDGYWGYKYYEVEAIPVSSLEELFSKDGEQLAREMFPIPKPSPENATERIIKSGMQVGFEEAYNLQEVKMHALKKEVEELREQIAALKEGYEGDEHLEHE